ncbi:MAG: universal stress protein UspA [Clostridiales bacterium]|nr:universal stress protein UspA [Clostridiales bacterium]MDY5756436.1 universal stress protein UspA [Eubacteriales bacterium]
MKKLNNDIACAHTSKTEHSTALMVCVTGQRSCERLVVHGKARLNPDQKLFVVHCVPEGKSFLGSNNDADAINYLFTVAKNAGAELTILRENNVVDALVAFAHEHNVKTIVVGASPVESKNSFNSRFSARLPGVEFDIVR